MQLHNKYIVISLLVEGFTIKLSYRKILDMLTYYNILENRVDYIA